MSALRLVLLALFLAFCHSRVIRATVGRPHVLIEVPDATYNVMDYGAKGDGKTNDTTSIQKALDTCGSAGGGTVLFPSPYTFLIDAIHISGSNTNMEIQKGATLLVSNDRSKWPGTADIITAKSYNNLAISGGGLINGQGQVWWENEDDFRPRTVYFDNVKQVLISDVTVQDPPNHVFEMYSDDTEFANVNVFAPPSTNVTVESHNTDAVDIHGQPFYVHDCNFTTGDDNIAAHANDTLVENCYFGTGHGASIGSICNEYVKNITFNNITFNQTTTGVKIKTDQGCGGYVKDVVYKNLVMYNVGTTIDITMYYTTSSDKTTLVIDGVTISNVTATNSKSAGEFNCVPESPCQNINLSNIQHKTSAGSWFCANAYGTASNVTPASCLKQQL